MNCNFCNQVIINPTKRKLYDFKRRGKIYCSSECVKIKKSLSSRERMIKMNKEYASDRMKKNNPSFNKEIIKKGILTKIKKGSFHKTPIIQGGNGKKTPIPVQMLNDRLNWTLRYIFRTGVHGFYPTHYKLEIANQEKQICIEIDGNSSYSRKDEAKKKEEYLESKGWITLRFKNKDILKNLESCVQTCLKIYEERRM